MGDATTPHAWRSRVARRISSSSAARVLVAHVAACVLDLLGDARPQAHAAVASTI
jgi:hypothetical protein